MKLLTLIPLFAVALPALTQERPAAPTPPAVQVRGEEQIPMPVGDEPMADRAPAQDPVPGRPVNEDNLKVLPELPEAQVKRDARTYQNEVYKSLYNKDLKPDQREDVLDE